MERLLASLAIWAVAAGAAEGPNLVGNGSFEADAQRDGVPDGWRASGSHIVIYVVAKQGIDVGTDKHAVVCSKHATICGGTSIPRARALMKYPEFCEACMESDPNI